MPDSWIPSTLSALRGRHEERTLQPLPATGPYTTIEGRPMLNLASNDYLGLAHHPDLARAAAASAQQLGTGATASRLVTGDLTLHHQVELELAQLKQCPAALLFGSGYLTSIGVVPALMGRHDLVLADRLAHACLLDGAHLSGAQLRRFRHNDLQHAADLLAQRPAGSRCLIVTESVFSMDGDLAPLSGLARLAADNDAMLLVDEAHATGVFGPAGGGLTCAPDVRPHVTVAMGTLSKALGGYGGYAAGSETLCTLLLNRARSFVFSTALPPTVVAPALAALRLLRDDPELGARLLAKAAHVRARLREAGLDTLQSESQIVPVMLGTNERTMEIAARLRQQGILVGAIRPPTVPPGTARLRLSISAAHTEDDLARAADAIIQAIRES